MKSSDHNDISQWTVNLSLERISETEFLERAGATREAMPAKTLGMLTRALADQDPDDAEIGLILMWTFGFDTGFLTVLHGFATAPWHSRHEDVVSALGKLAEPESVGVLAQAAVADFPYLKRDEAFALGTKSIYALKNIGTPEAVREIGALHRNSNLILKKAAHGRLPDIAKNGKTEAAKAEAAEQLRP